MANPFSHQEDSVTATATAPKLSASDRRFEFIREAFAPLVDLIEANGRQHPAADHPVWNEVSDRIAAEGPAFGRTQRWHDACAWYSQEHRDAEGPHALTWLVVQGQVHLGYAAE